MIEKNVSRETFLLLQKFVQLLLKWNQSINLISAKTEDDVWDRHVLDSLQLQSYLPDKDAQIVDLGSGAGFPGVVLALAGYQHITLLEKDTKKAAFLRNVSRETMVPMTVLEKDLREVKGQFDVVVARGLADLSTLLDYSYPLLKPTGYALFLKGENCEDEIFQAHKGFWEMTIEKKESITNPRATILKVGSIRKKTGAFSDLNCSRKSKRRGGKNNDRS